jgi:hypothetical protein
MTLYLRTLAMAHEGKANKDAIAILERWSPRSELRAGMGSAGTAVLLRCHLFGRRRGGISALECAYKRALSLEPGRVSAAGLLAANEAEGGNLDRAYDDARALVRKRPDAAFAHYSLAYVLRYAGRLDEAQSECDKALASIGELQLAFVRACFCEAGKAARAMEYLNLDAGSEWSNAMRVSVLMRQGKMTEAQQATPQMTENPMWMRGLVQACLNQGAGNGNPPSGGAGRKRIIAGSRIPNEVLPGYVAGGLRRKADCIRVSAPGRGRELLRAPGIAIGSAAGGRARRCGVPPDCASGGGLPAEIRAAQGLGR